MKSYKDFEREYIGSSDCAALIIAGFQPFVGLATKVIDFGEDGDYKAYIVNGPAEIGKHYSKVAEFYSWVRIYDDEALIKQFNADQIIIYRAGMRGCIIQLINDTEKC